jgi:hypothetical protein
LKTRDDTFYVVDVQTAVVVRLARLAPTLSFSHHQNSDFHR